MNEMSNTARRSIELLGICALGFIIYWAGSIIMPLVLAFLLAIMLLPLYRFLKRIRLPEALAITLSIGAVLLAVVGIGYFFTFQVIQLISDIPEIQKNLNVHWTNVSGWINEKIHFTATEQLDILRKQSDAILGNVGNYLSGAFISLSNVFIFFGLIPLYIFLILFYKNLLLRFAFLWFNQTHHSQVEEVLTEVETMTKSYLTGLLIQITYITVLLGGGLALLGIKHALLIGVIFAMLNLIPYIGALIGNIIGVLLTLTTSQELWQVWAVLGVIAVVQFLDNNILMPRIVGGKVRLNALASIVGVFLGGALAGVSGMFLSLPIMAMLKIIFDRSESFRQWGLLLGDDNPNMSPMSHPALRLRNRKRRMQSPVAGGAGSDTPDGAANS